MPNKNNPPSNEAELNLLVTNQVPEGKTIEYKLVLPGSSDEDKKEFLADVSSFSNAAGGVILYGLREAERIIEEIPGLLDDRDQAILRLENLIRDGIAPRIIGLSMQTIQLSTGNYVLSIHIPNSWSKPHMVTFKGTSRFFTRNSAGKYQMDVQEIRQSFLLSESIAKRIENFRLERFGKIAANEGAVLLPDSAKLVFHSIPLGAFQTLETIDLSDISSTFFSTFYPVTNGRYNIDGYVAYTDYKQDYSKLYFQLFRNGLIEFVNSDIIYSPRNDDVFIIPGIEFEKELINACSQILEFQKSMGIDTPIFLFLSLIGVKNVQVVLSYQHNPIFDGSRRGIDRDNLMLPEVMIDKFPDDMDDISKILKPIFDALANASGLSRSLSYDRQGNWRPNR